MRIDNQEYAERLALHGIEWSVRQIVKKAKSSRLDRCERLVSEQICEVTGGCSWYENSPWPQCKD